MLIDLNIVFLVYSSKSYNPQYIILRLLCVDGRVNCILFNNKTRVFCISTIDYLLLGVYGGELCGFGRQAGDPVHGGVFPAIPAMFPSDGARIV